MKTELRVQDHNVLPGQKVVEIWYGGQFIGTVVGADGPGVRVISKCRLENEKVGPDLLGLTIIEVSIHGP